MLKRWFVKASSLLWELHFWQIISGLLYDCSMYPYQIWPRRTVAFAIEKFKRSQKPTIERFFGSLVVILMHSQDWFIKNIFEKNAFTLVTNTLQKTWQPLNPSEPNWTESLFYYKWLCQDMLNRWFVKASSLLSELHFWPSISGLLYDCSMYLYQIRTKRMVAFAIKKVQRSQNPQMSSFLGAWR